MKPPYICVIVAICFISLVFLGRLSSESHKGTEKDVLEQISFRLPEIGKAVEFELEPKHLDAAPLWDGGDFKAIPVSMERAVNSAKSFLKDNGCTVSKYYLYECSIIRLFCIPDSKQWYWKVSFCDRSAPSASVDPILSIPVMLDGVVPKASFIELK